MSVVIKIQQLRMKQYVLLLHVHNYVKYNVRLVVIYLYTPHLFKNMGSIGVHNPWLVF